MGGAKKQSPAQAEKKQSGEAAKKAGAKSKKGKKDDKESKSPQVEIRVILTDEQAMKAIEGSKAITAQELSRQTGVKISAANTYLVNLLQKGTVKRIGGYSGHHIYASVSA